MVAVEAKATVAVAPGSESLTMNDAQQRRHMPSHSTSITSHNHIVASEKTDLLQIGVDEELATLTSGTPKSVLLHQRNLLVPIACLPREILAKVFVHCRDIVLESKGEQLNEARLRTFYHAVMQVCQVWRSVALQCPRLFSVVHVNSGDLDWTQKVLNLAKSCPLSITLEHLRGDQAESAISQIVVRMPAIYHMTLTLHDKPSERIHALLASSPAPHLESLLVVNSGASLDGTWRLPWKNVFNDHYPALKTLAIITTFFPWHAALLRCSTLTSLTLIVRGVVPEMQPKAIELVDLLGSLPNLQALMLAHHVPSDMDGLGGKIAHLQQLKTLDLTASADFLSLLMTCMLLPPTVHLRLTVHRCSSTASFASLSDSIQSHCSTWADEDLRPMFGVELAEWKDSLRQSWILRFRVRNSPEATFETLWLEVRLAWVSLSQAESLVELSDAFRWMFVRTVEVRIQGETLHAPSFSYTYFLSSFVAAEVMHVVGPLDNIVSALMDRNSAYVMPLLLELSLSRSFISDQQLLSWLTWRAKIGHRIQTISLVQCTHSWPAAEEKHFCDGVNACVEDVVWWGLRALYQGIPNTS
jgi:hypothetical protein